MSIFRKIYAWGSRQRCPDIDFAHAAISKFTASWPGAPIDKLGAVRHLNTSGTLPPVIWFFNSAHEPVNLAAALGKDRPLFAMRSLNMIMAPSEKRGELIPRLARHFATLLQAHLPREIALVGGNCQGAPFAMWTANSLLDAGHRIGGAATIDAVPDIHLNLPVLLNFGTVAPTLNPFETEPDATDQLCNRCYQSYKKAYLPYPHGAYLEMQNIDVIMGHLNDFMAHHGV